MANVTFGDLVNIPKYREQMQDLLNHGELEEIVEKQRDQRRVHFAEAIPAARIYGKIGRAECQIIVDTGAEVSVITEPMAKLLKLKP